ncbi:MAG: acetylglutamate kinase [Cyclobacteriaceae bacterium]|nr:MAG: acetylglutamate kinase [Cyclobacteriaceae bacterium]
MDKDLFILKIGGRVMDHAEQLDEVLDKFASVSNPKILVHGGGNRASEISKKLGLTPRMVDGRRITDNPTLEVVTMVYGGLVNKNLVAKLQALNVNAIGLSGADGNILPAVKRPVDKIDYGYAGDLPDYMPSSDTLQLLLNHGLVPVCCPLTHDGNGQLLNTNADTIASYLGVSLSRYYRVTLVYCLDKPGVLKDPDDHNSVISQLQPDTYQQLVQSKVIVEGMIPKLDNAFSGLRLGIREIYLCDWKDITGSSGTKITLP